MDRREFLKAAAAFSSLSAAVSKPVWAQQAPEMANDFWVRPRTIRLRRDGQRLESTYWIDGEIRTEAWREISWFMRDKTEDKAVWMQPVLLDILYGIDGWLRYYSISDPVDLSSGHRTPEHNSRLYRELGRSNEGAAKDSEHIHGGAGDIRHASVPSEKFAKFGIWLGGGGVGWYPSKNFTHVDRGRLRFWRG